MSRSLVIKRKMNTFVLKHRIRPLHNSGEKRYPSDAKGIIIWLRMRKNIDEKKSIAKRIVAGVKNKLAQ